MGKETAWTGGVGVSAAVLGGEAERGVGPASFISFFGVLTADRLGGEKPSL